MMILCMIHISVGLGLIRSGSPNKIRLHQTTDYDIGCLKMEKELKIDRAIYLVNDESRTYRFLRRNPVWKNLDSKENEANKKHIDGYTRIFRTGNKKKYLRNKHP